MTFNKDFARALESDKERAIREKLTREFIPVLFVGMLISGFFGWLLP